MSLICRNILARARTIRLLADQRAVAATEFALLLPFLLTLYVGATQLILGILINRQVALTANTVANIVSQYSSISAGSQMPDVLNAAVQIFSPNSTTPANLVVSLVTIDNAGKATVAWSQTLNGTARKVGAIVALPTALDVPNTNLVFSEAGYTYTPVFTFVPLPTMYLYAPIFTPPRNSTTINLLS